MDENENDDDDTNHQDYTSTVGGESDTFFECIEDRSLANRARRSLRSDVHSSSHRSLLSSPDGQPNIPKQYNNNSNGAGGLRRGLENIHENNNYNNHNNNNNGINGIGSDDVVRVHESALHALQQLKEELVKSNQRNEELSRERESWKEEQQRLQQEVSALQTTDRQRATDLDRLRQDHERLRIDNEATSKQRDQLVEDKRDLEVQSRDAARTTKELRHRTLAADNRHKELKGQLDKLNDELEGALSAKGGMAAELARAQTERMELETETEELRKQLSEATQERDRTSSYGQRSEDELRLERRKLQELRASSDAEIGRLNGSLRKANEALHRLRAELTPKVRSAVRHMTSPSSSGARGGAMATTQTFDGMQHTSRTTASSSAGGPPPTLDSAIADRLARLRDSAERAHLIRGHKRELARFKADRDATIQKLETDHADALKKAAKQFDSRRTSELEDLAKKIHRQHESHLEEVEDEHRKRVLQLQKDYGRSQEESDESLEEALTRVARLTQDHERETGRRHALERTIEDLHRQKRTQQNESLAKHAGELEKVRRHWESEKEVLLGSLQRDCNVAFDNRRHRNNNWAAAAAVAGTGTGMTGATTTAGTAVRGSNDNNNNGGNNDIHIDTSDTPRSMLSQGQGFRYRHPSGSSQQQQQQQQQQRYQQQQQPTGPSPLSMSSAIFFAENKSSAEAGVARVVPSPTNRHDQYHSSRPIEMVTGVDGGAGSGGSPSMISKSYSDIDSVLRETEELVQSIL